MAIGAKPYRLSILGGSFAAPKYYCGLVEAGFAGKVLKNVITGPKGAIYSFPCAAKARLCSNVTLNTGLPLRKGIQASPRRLTGP